MPEEEDRRRLGLWVQDRRLGLGISVREAARRAGMDRATWAGMEDGTRQTQDTKYAAIEDVIQVPRGSIMAKLRNEPLQRPAVGSEEWWDDLARKLPRRDFLEVLEVARARLPKRIAERYLSSMDSETTTQSRE